MHKLLIPLFSILFVLAAGCGGSNIVRPKNNNTGRLSDTDYNRLVDLNTMQKDNIDARKFLYGDLVQPLISEKAKDMAQKISGCQKHGEIPENDFNGEPHEQIIDGNGCPIIWGRTRTWSITGKVMYISDRLVIVSETYRKNYTAMSERAFAGRYAVKPEDIGFSVDGLITFSKFQTVNYGNIAGTITINHRNKYNEGGGSVIMNLQGRGWGSTATIKWTLRRGATTNITYLVNNAKIDQEQFNSLFSAYELDKYMENTLKMR